MNKLLAVGIILTATASYASEAQFPTDGTATLCERDAQASGKLDCRMRELNFRVELKEKWAAIPEDYRATCLSEQNKDFAVYYSKLAVCIANKYKGK